MNEWNNQKAITHLTILSLLFVVVFVCFVFSIRLERETAEDTVVNGVFFPKGMLVAISVWALNYDPEIWENPEEFNPER